LYIFITSSPHHRNPDPILSCRSIPQTRTVLTIKTEVEPIRCSLLERGFEPSP